MAYLSRTKQRSTPPDNTAQLVAQAQADPAVFGALYNQYIQPIYRYIYSRVGNRQEAEDLSAQTFLSAFQALPGYREQDQFPAWLFSIARNKVMDYFRQNQREVSTEAPAVWRQTPDVQEQAHRNLEVERLSALVDSLEENEQELIRLRYVAGLTFSQMASVLGKREAAVKKALYRLQARLKSQMEAKNE